MSTSTEPVPDSQPIAPPRRKQKPGGGTNIDSEDSQEVNNTQDDYGIEGLPICQSEDEDYDGEDFMQSLSSPGTPTTPLNGPISPLAKQKTTSKSGSTSSHRSSCSSHSDCTDDLHNSIDTNSSASKVQSNKPKGKPQSLKKSISGKLFGKKSKKDKDKDKGSVKTKDSVPNRSRLSIDLSQSNLVGKMVKLFSKEPGLETTNNTDGKCNDKSGELAEHPEDAESDRDEFYEFSDFSDEEEDTFDTDPSTVKNKVEDTTQESAGSAKGAEQSESGNLDNSNMVEDSSSAGENNNGKASVSETEKPAKVVTIDIKVRDPQYSGMYWSQLPRVQESGILDRISSNDRKHQEAMFEILKSEESNLISLNNFIRVYLSPEEFGPSEKPILSAMDQKVVFSNITAIRDTSEKFLAELETKWQTSGLLLDICDIIRDFATNHFNSYIAYCSNQAFQDKKLEELKKNTSFMEAVKRLQTHEACMRLPLVSFLVLPMQRITRLPLLVSAVIKYIDPAKQPRQYEAAISTLGILNNVVAKCNERAKKMQQAEEIFLLSKQIVFKDVPPVTIITSSRYLVKKGSLSCLPQGKSISMTFAKKKKQTLHLFLFNDILLLTKKDGERYMVIDHAERAMLHVETFDEPDEKSTSGLTGEARTKLLPPGIPNYCINPFLIVILENCKQKRMEYLFDCTTESARSDRERWLDALRPVRTTDTQETIYEDWVYQAVLNRKDCKIANGSEDCPQVLCLRKYEAKEPDELTLEESDVVRVFKKLEDGMYEGERLRDGERGWFPQEYTVEVNDSHARARNLRMQYMLATSTFNTNL